MVARVDEPVLVAKGGRTMRDNRETFVGFNVATRATRWRLPRIAGKVKSGTLGEISADATSVRRLVSRLEKQGAWLPFCCEAGPTG
jgi:hypothetical protein